MATQQQIEDGPPYGYGYFLWLYRSAQADLNVAWDYDGQLVYVVPEHDIVVVDLVIDYVIGAVQ
jgi:hypothetical protein